MASQKSPLIKATYPPEEVENEIIGRSDDQMMWPALILDP